MGASFTHFSAAEVEEALRFAKEKLGYDLDRDTLRRLGNDTGIRWYRDGKKPQHLVRAKREVLEKDLWIRDRCDHDRRNAYSSTVSKLFSIRAQYSRKRRTKLTETVRTAVPDQSVLFGELPNGQRIMLFPHQ